jgi:antagonist of KipI
MSAILVHSPGLFTTVQDLGRHGFGLLGVSPSGAADPLSLRLGNRLAGNPEGAAALEMTLSGGTFEFPDGGVFVLAGAPCALPGWTPVAVKPGETVRTGTFPSAARCYLCVRGGIQVREVLGSASTHVLSGLGGYEGRPLRRGDRLFAGDAPGPAPARREMVPLGLSFRKTLRVTRGLQASAFPAGALEQLCSGAYKVGVESNRMGLRLEGAPVEAPRDGRMVTEGVPLGAVQIPASGQPMILFVEQQTTGGYPKLANVIAADLPSVGQLRPRDEIRFLLVDEAEARRAYVEQERLVRAFLEGE